MTVHLLHGTSWTREALLFSPLVFAVLSLVHVSINRLNFLWNPSSDALNGKAPDHKASASTVDGSKVQNLRNVIKELDGLAITLFRLVRLLAVLALLSLEVFELSAGQGSSARFYQPPFYIYTLSLATLSVVATQRWRDMVSLQLALLLLVEFIVYFVLDAWPYATLNSMPFDSASDPVTWARLSLLAFASVIVPLIMPRPFRPLTPEDEPSQEDTVSLLSRYTYSYLDKIVFYAYRVPDITVADMPRLPARERIEALGQRALEAMDPMDSQVGNRHVLWGVAKLWGKDYAFMTLWMSLHALTEFASPYGMKNLLLYLETGTPPMGLRPWVWILVLTIGPILSAGLFTQVLFDAARTMVEATSVFTYLVFHHALRIRLKSDALDNEKDGPKEKDTKKGADTSPQASVEPATTDAETPADSEDVAMTTAAASDTEPVPEGGHVKEKTGHLVGKINNLITTDMGAIQNTYYIVSFPAAVLQLVVSVIFLYSLLGWSAFVGLAVMIVCSPVPMYLAKLMANVQRMKMGTTDKRVQAVTESLGILRMIKLFSWESYILKQLARSRDKELSKIRRFKFFEVAMNSTNQIIPLFAKLTVLSLYTLITKGSLSGKLFLKLCSCCSANFWNAASRIFSALMVFSIMEEQLARIMYTVPELLRAKVSYDRYNNFLNSTELLSEGNALLEQLGEGEQAITSEQPGNDTIGFKACTFSWDPFKHEESTESRRHHARKQFHLRFDDEVTFQRGHINLIVGPTASGKTSLLMALLGEMYYKPHGIGSWYSLPREAGIAYAPQETWVLNETIRENILFGEPYDEERYKKVLKQCALERDLGLWEAGDLTEVGEKGLTLSGGQKARVTLARALYSPASIILLDDVLAALDVHTAKWIANKALQGDLVQGRTVLLVTHNIALTASIAKHVVVLGRQGKFSAQGPVSEILKKDTRLRAQAEKEREAIEEDIETKLDGDKKDKDDTRKSTGKLVVAEEKAMGRVEIAATMLYVGGVGGPLIWTLILGTRWVAILGMIFQVWFVGYWSNQYIKHPASEVPVLKYLGFYALANLSGYLFDSVSYIIWILGSLRASKVIYSSLLESIFSAPFRQVILLWLDITPVGRIVTRCTQDISIIDDQLARMAVSFMSNTINLICLFFASVFMVGWYALIPGLVVAISGGFLGRVYLKCQICVRREMSNAKGPVMTQVGTALSSLPSIRAYNAQDLFRSELQKRINKYTRTALTFQAISRWVSIRVDSLGAIFSGVVSVYLVYGGRVEAGFAGFTLSMVLSFTRLILSWVRYHNLLEIQGQHYLIFLERMLEFLRIEHEPKPADGGKPPAYWPSSGNLRVENLSARYSDDSPKVLRDISFEVQSGERVGIVGRTGAGKSSIALALLRAIKTTGKVYFDGLATDEMNLDALRSNITLIPQQPELIHGILRENLDPWGYLDDASLNDALRAAGFFDVKESVSKQYDSQQEQVDQTNQNSTDAEGNPDNAQTNANAKIGLDTVVESGGTNFSMGQRQIIALARAIVRRSKLLILDEATAAIDYNTDIAIQKTLRTEFSKDTTLITIAHRLQTIIDYDKIMVLDAGQLVEFDSPKKLLEKESGLLRALVDESDDRDALLKLAGVQ
ncbi:P-loop containing nucleoside triphosphate hydrolase protein [Phellopilus nigrolimitatus]|nr:P-loop containing nucleoside triphosphate hydrolase protein [Phellopilus nigrolimitatus]